MEYEISTFWALEKQANNDTWTQILREENVALKTHFGPVTAPK